MTYILRVRGPSNSQKNTPWYVPSARPPSLRGIRTCGLEASDARASLASSPQVLIPLKDGALALGTYQGVFFCEFDGPRTRKIYVTTLS